MRIWRLLPTVWSCPASGLLLPAWRAWSPLADLRSSPRGLAAGRPTLAICVGHQVLFEAGIEHGVRAAGCNIWPGLVERLHAERLPHMGWNTVETADGSRLFTGVEAESFYFVHSYGVRDLPAAPHRQITWAEHGGDRFVAAVEDGTLWSTQFHPEKSGNAGGRLIRNWVSTL